MAADGTLATRLSPAVRSCLLSRCAAVLAHLSAAVPAETATEQPPEAEQWLPLSEVVQRTGYGSSTIRAWVAAGFFQRGAHFVGEGKKRRFLLAPIKVLLSEVPPGPAQEGAPQAIPFVRKGRRRA